MADKPPHEPSMEEILASIRRIIAADESETKTPPPPQIEGVPALSANTADSDTPKQGENTLQNTAPPEPFPTTETTDIAVEKIELDWPAEELFSETTPQPESTLDEESEADESLIDPAFRQLDLENLDTQTDSIADIDAPKWAHQDSDAYPQLGPATAILRKPADLKASELPRDSGSSDTNNLELTNPESPSEEDLNTALNRIKAQIEADDPITQRADALLQKRQNQMPKESTHSIGTAMMRLRSAKANRSIEEERAYVAGLEATDIDDAVRRAKQRAEAALEEHTPLFFAEDTASDFENTPETDHENFTSETALSGDIIDLNQRLNSDGSITDLGLPATLLGGQSQRTEPRNNQAPAKKHGNSSQDSQKTASSYARESGLKINAETQARMVSAFAQIASTDSPGTGLEQAVDPEIIESAIRDAVRPMLREWIQDNLPPMVERIVREEVSRMSAMARRRQQAQE